jgi:hypothetical protein
MSLYDALQSLPANRRLTYAGPHGATAVVTVEVTASGALFATLRVQTAYSIGQPRVTSRGYAIHARADCRDMEMALWDLGMDPEQYAIV